MCAVRGLTGRMALALIHPPGGAWENRCARARAVALLYRQPGHMGEDLARISAIPPSRSESHPETHAAA
jgi:hypothetical protein